MKMLCLVVVVRPLRISLVIRQERRTHVDIVRCNDELLCGRYKVGVSISGAVHLHSMDG